MTTSQERQLKRNKEMAMMLRSYARELDSGEADVLTWDIVRPVVADDSPQPDHIKRFLAGPFTYAYIRLQHRQVVPQTMPFSEIEI